MEIKKLEIDYDNRILKINGMEFKEIPIVITLPGPEGWPRSVLINPERASGSLKGCAELTVIFNGPNNRP